MSSIRFGVRCAEAVGVGAVGLWSCGAVALCYMFILQATGGMDLGGGETGRFGIGGEKERQHAKIMI